MSQRLQHAFDAAKKHQKALLIGYLMAFDPDKQTTLEAMDSMVHAGVNVIELGMAFTDLMADGPVIQEAAARALSAGSSIKGILDIIAQFRIKHPDFPVILMGYANPLYAFGLEKFILSAKACKTDGFLVVDLPIEEDDLLSQMCYQHGMAHIKLVTPTTDNSRLRRIATKATGFVYYVAVTGITGANAAHSTSLDNDLANIKAIFDIPVAAGFGVKTIADLKRYANHADAVVVGSSLVKTLHEEGIEALKKQLKTFSDVLNCYEEKV